MTSTLFIAVASLFAVCVLLFLTRSFFCFVPQFPFFAPRAHFVQPDFDSFEDPDFDSTQEFPELPDRTTSSPAFAKLNSDFADTPANVGFFTRFRRGFCQLISFN